MSQAQSCGLHLSFEKARADSFFCTPLRLCFPSPFPFFSSSSPFRAQVRNPRLNSVIATICESVSRILREFSASRDLLWNPIHVTRKSRQKFLAFRFRKRYGHWKRLSIIRPRVGNCYFGKIFIQRSFRCQYFSEETRNRTLLLGNFLETLHSLILKVEFGKFEM